MRREPEKIAARDFVHRLHDDVTRSAEARYVFFLGAGCSVTSGIPLAADLARDWVERLKQRGVSLREESLADPGGLYAEAFKSLFPNPEQQEEEIGTICARGNPGFGYATLANLMARDKRLNTVVTTNFDNLLVEALYLYTDARPMVVEHGVAGRVRVYRESPTIVKVLGDAHLFWKSAKAYRKDIKNAFRKLLSDRGLIFVGYAGNDDCVASALSLFGVEHLRQVYWVNVREPGIALGAWLRRHGFTWVDHLDFDELLLMIQDEFRLPHPPPSRFERIVRGYAGALLATADRFARPLTADMYRRVTDSARTAGFRLEEDFAQQLEYSMYRIEDGQLYEQFLCTKDSRLLMKRVEALLRREPLWGSAGESSAMPQRISEILQEGLILLRESRGLLPEDADFLVACGDLFRDELKDLDAACRYYAEAEAIAPDSVVARSRLDELTTSAFRVSPSGIEEPARAAVLTGDADCDDSARPSANVSVVHADELAWVASKDDDVVLSVHPSAVGAWKRAIPNGTERGLRELVVETPPKDWHITEPRNSRHWNSVERRIGARLDELDHLQCKRVHVFANAPYALGALLGNRLSRLMERGRGELVFYQFNERANTWEDWGPNRQRPTPTRPGPMLWQTPATNATGARHVAVVIHISRRASREEVGRALANTIGNEPIELIDVAGPDGRERVLLRDPSEVDRCVNDVDDALVGIAARFPTARMHIFYAGPLALWMRAAAKIHLLSVPATLYERILVDGTYVFVPALDLPGGALLMGEHGIDDGPVPAGRVITSSAELPTRLRVLAVATEWESKKGGLSTFNRLLCRALVRGGHEVVCLVPEARTAEQKSAADAGVRLLDVSQQGVPDAARLFLKPADPTLVPSVVIGHGRVTGDAANCQSRTHYPGSFLIHFVHTEPNYIEWFKGNVVPEDASRKADERRADEVRLASQADIVVGVGPVLTRWIHDELLVGARKNVPIHRLDPGLTDILPVQTLPKLVRCLLLGRAEDWRLKGIDIAVRALGTYPGQAPELMVRGVPEGGAHEFMTRISSLAPRLLVRPFGYSADEETIDADVRMASLVLMPSRREGFGLVGLEAISASVPVLVSDQSGLGQLLREIGTPQAQRAIVETSGVDSEADVVAWSRAIGNVLHNLDASYQDAAKLRADLAPVLDWNKAVEKLVDELRRIVAARGRER
ncbi:glycosyltransferase [Sorangium sp. So ce341]|uniref:glycosyltransferase n=1 Tax=Sorangium sp. So ce341 TaxID=3133302 RepID=UPI003F5F9845